MRADLTARRGSALVGVALAMLAPLSALAELPAHAETASSAKTVAAKDYDPDAANSPFPDLKVTVSQTENLIQQGIKVSWTGGKKSTTPNQQTGGQDFLQIAQCWGDEAGSNGSRPDRTTCQYGGLNLPGATRWATRESPNEVATEDAAYTALGSSRFDATLTAIPFNSKTGVSVASVVDGKRVKDAPDLDNNEFFTKFTTNEVSWAGTAADGSGSVKMELQTAQQSPGLGCGTPINSGGMTTGSSCWLVIIPRGETDATGTSITQPGLFWETWKHHLAVRLGFKPAGLSCDIGAAERQLSGSELLTGAVGQWQPKLCGRTNGAVYSLLTGPESDAALAANGTAPAPMALTSRALSVPDVPDNLTYAPVGLTGVSIAFAIDHRALTTGGATPDSVMAKDAQAFTALKLTPRLLAKLLTGSYTDALPQAADKSHLSGPQCITKDPDFLAVNDKEWSFMSIVGVGVSDTLVPLGRSDAAVAIWTYIMADADARAFLDGRADPWGMKVNPYYSTDSKVNPTHVGLALPADSFPKADPVEAAGTPEYHNANAVNLVTWRPFTSSLDIGAYNVLRGDPLPLGAWDPSSNPPKFAKGSRDLVGQQAVIGLTDTTAGARYQVYQAALLNPAGQYVTPTTAAMTAAASAMTRSKGQSQVVSFEPSSKAAKDAKAAYPLTMPVYAAVNLAMTDDALRADYAAFIGFAAGDGQTPGTGDGELPDGYAPLPADWRTQAMTAAAGIKAGAVAATPSPSPSPSSASTTSTGRSASATTPTSGPNPTPAGTAAGTLAGSTTQTDPAIGAMAAVVPAAAGVGIAAALGVPLLVRLRRRQT